MAKATMFCVYIPEDFSTTDFWDNSNGQFNVCLNIAGTRYEIAFDREFLYRNVESIAV